MKADSSETLCDLRVRLEVKQVLDFCFEFWDVQACCKVGKLFGITEYCENNVFMIPSSNEGIEIVFGKRPRVGADEYGTH